MLGVLARKQIASSGGTKTGAGMAMAGLVMGALGIVLTVGLVIVAAVTGSCDYSYSTS